MEDSPFQDKTPAILENMVNRALAELKTEEAVKQKRILPDHVVKSELYQLLVQDRPTPSRNRARVEAFGHNPASVAASFCNLQNPCENQPGHLINNMNRNQTTVVRLPRKPNVIVVKPGANSSFSLSIHMKSKNRNSNPAGSTPATVKLQQPKPLISVDQIRASIGVKSFAKSTHSSTSAATTSTDNNWMTLASENVSNSSNHGFFQSSFSRSARKPDFIDVPEKEWNPTQVQEYEQWWQSLPACQFSQNKL